jgi:methyl-accepting chemotaxis protein
MAQENLNIVIRAFDKTSAGFRKVRDGLGGISKRVLNVKTAVAGLGGALALRQFSQQIDDIAKQSDRLGITVAQLQSLQFAASQTGTGAEELKKGFERFNKSISEASTGIGTGMRAFEMLGIQVTNTDGTLKDSNQLLNEVADGFTRVKDPADRVRIAMDLFGRSGAGMVNMLQNGSEELDAIRDQFGALTIELTGEQAKAVEEANDRFDALGRTFSSIGHRITSVVMPALAAVATFLTVNMLKAIAGTISGFRGLINSFIGGLNVLSRQLGIFDEIQKSTIGEATERDIRSVIDAYQSLPEPVTMAAESVQGVATAMERQETAIQKAKKSFDEYAETAQEVQANLANVALKGVKSLEDSLVGIVTGATSAKDAFRSMAQSIIADLARMAIQKAITAPIAGALGGLFGGKAIGGSVQRGRPVMVGERGAELFVPSSSGSIVSNKNLSGAGVGGGGITVNQTINVTTGVQQTVRSEIVNLMPQIANATKAAVADSRLRGGSFSKAFGG